VKKIKKILAFISLIPCISPNFIINNFNDNNINSKAEFLFENFVSPDEITALSEFIEHLREIYKRYSHTKRDINYLIKEITDFTNYGNLVFRRVNLGFYPYDDRTVIVNSVTLGKALNFRKSTVNSLFQKVGYKSEKLTDDMIPRIITDMVGLMKSRSWTVRIRRREIPEEIQAVEHFEILPPQQIHIELVPEFYTNPRLLLNEKII